MNLSVRSLSILIAMTLLFSDCNKPSTPNTAEDTSVKKPLISAVVVFSVGESMIVHSDSTQEKATMGTTVSMGDKLKTGEKSKVDIQFPDGSNVRVAPSTEIDFSKLAIGSAGESETQLALVSGKVFAKVEKARKEDSFSVVTPTAIAGVRGTSFIVEETPGKASKVKVIEGSVALAPRVKAIENLSDSEIESNPDFKKLKESIAINEVILEKNQASSISSKINPANSETIETLDVKATLKSLEKEKPKVVVADTTKSEEQELKTIVRVDEKTAQKLVQLNQESDNSKDEAKLKAVEEERKRIEKDLSEKQEVEKRKFAEEISTKPKEIKNRQDLVNYYERIEKVILSNGKTIIGAIIDQEGSIMVIHTEQGIRRINQSDIDEVIYDFAIKK